MYYAEEIINGVLCFKFTPEGDWIEFSKESLTRVIINLRKSIEILNLK